MQMILRELHTDDLPFLRQMVVETINWKPGRDATFDDVMTDERMERYIVNWGRDGDGGVIAEKDSGPIGAVWWRYHTAAEPSYGYVADDIPEIAIAIAEDGRGKGLGRKLIQAAKATLSKIVDRVSLSVEADNFALKLYESEGFVIVDQENNDITMICELTSR